ncbi:MAG: hypothetical protein AAFX50_23975, partial [Acidobacteriota bacterium]
ESDVLADVRGLALDAEAGRLYWANLDEADRRGGLYAADTDGSNLTTVVPNLELPHDVALDLVNDHVYWTEILDSGPMQRGAIRRADLDGTNIVDIVSPEAGRFRGVDVDPVGGKVYWTDLDCDCILRSDLDGTNRETILDASDGVNRPHDVAVDAAAGEIYWTEGISNSDDPTGRIRKAALDGSNPADVYTGLPSFIRDLTFTALDVGEIFSDGFESGDTSLWTAEVP